MRPSVPIIAALVLGTALPALAQQGQEGTTLDIGGGVSVPVPAEQRPGVQRLNPTEADREAEDDDDTGGVQRVQGRESGRTTTDEEGNEQRVYQSSRVVGVEHSVSARERFNWFYAAEEVYFGIIPHIRDTLPHLLPYQARGGQASERNEITWIGFQAFPDVTRVFVQLARFPSYTVEEFEEGRVIALVFDRTRLSLSNFTRFIDTTYFDRSVELVDAENLPGERARVVIWRDQVAPYTVSLDGNYVYIDFQDVRAGRRPSQD